MHHASPDSPAWQVRLFGPLAVHSPSGERVAFTGRKTAVLFGFLCLEPGRSYTREFLAEALWPNLELANRQTRLRQELIVLRKRVGDAANDGLLLTTRTTVGLQAARVSTDYQRFQAAALRAAAAPGAEAPRVELIALFQGELLEEGDALGESARRAAARTFEEAVWDLAQIYGTARRYDEAIGLLERLCSRDPLREDIHLRLMEFHHRAGRTSRVQQQLQYAESLWARQLQSPLPAALREQVQRLTHSGERESPAQKPPDAPMPPAVAQRQSYRRRPYRGIWVGGILALVVAAGAVYRRTPPRLQSPPAPPVAPRLESAPLRWQYRDQPDEGERPDSEGTAIAQSPSGILAVTGLVQTRTEDTDILTLFFEPGGRLIHRTRYSGEGHDCDRAYAIATDDQSCFFVAGESCVPSDDAARDGWHLLLLKYDSRGTKQVTYLAPQRMKNQGHRIQAQSDRHGGAFLAGTTIVGKDEKPRPLLQHIDAQGKCLWSRTITYQDRDASFVALCTDDSGNLYLCGQLAGGGWLVTSYTPSGTRRWAESVFALGDDGVGNVHCNRFGTVFLTGVHTTALGKALTLVRLTDTGRLLGVTHDTVGHADLRFASSALSDNHARLAVGGSFSHPDGRVESRLVLFDDQGNPRWRQNQVAATPDVSLATRNLHVGSRGGVLSTGLLTDQPLFHLYNNGDMHTVYYGADGTPKWTYRLGDANGLDIVNAIAPCHDGVPILVGQKRPSDGRSTALQIFALDAQCEL